MTTSGDPYIICEGGVVQNDPALPVFDLDALDDSDPDGLCDLYERLLDLPQTGQAAPSSMLRYALVRTEAAMGSLTGADAELLALARTDASLREELIYAARQSTGSRQLPVLGETGAQYLAARVLGGIGIACPENKQIALTDADPDRHDTDHLQINSGQLAYAVEQYRQSTGVEIAPDELESYIPWI